MMSKDIAEICEEKARRGDGLFAIAHALNRLAEAQENVASKLDMIGYGTLHDRGPLPEIAAQIGNLASKFELLVISAAVDVTK